MAKTESGMLTLYVLEEQEIYRELYRSALTCDASKQLFDVLGISTNGDVSALRRAIAELKPDVVLMGTGKLNDHVIHELEQIRNDEPAIGIVLLLRSYDINTPTSLSSIGLKGPGGTALFLKQSLQRVEQLSEIIQAVSRGHIILDPTLANLMFAERTQYQFLRELTTREGEVLNLIAKGYTNAAIAEYLCVDIKTVEHHINSVYSKLRSEVNFDRKHPRVSVARLYLQAIGDLTPREMPGGGSARLSAGQLQGA